VFTNECLEAFERIKKALISASILQPPNKSLPCELMCNTSDFDVRAVLGQRRDEKLFMNYYVSKTLDITEKEMLAAVFMVEKFRLKHLMGKKRMSSQG